MRYNLLLSAAVGLYLLSVPSQQLPAQTPGVATVAPGLACNGTRILDPFQCSLACPDLRPALLPIEAEVKSGILRSCLPCPDNVTPNVQTPPNGKEAVGLDNLQRGFDFYSWRTFIALNSPADGSPIEQAQADKPTLWEDMDSFKQLLDVMLPDSLQPPKWPTDRAGMEAERERLVPPERLTQHRAAPTKMIVKMIEELQQPFKTGR